MKSTIKRVLFYLVLGFVTTWLVAWGLAMLPRVVQSGYVDRHLIGGFKDDNDVFYNHFREDSRWIGVKEDRFSVVKVRNNQDTPVEFTVANRSWWILETGLSRFDEIDLSYDLMDNLDDSSIEFPRTNSSYSNVRFGWPYLSHEAQGAVHQLPSLGPLTGKEYQKVTGAFCTKIPKPPPLPPSAPASAQIFIQVYTVLSFSERMFFPYNPLWSGLLVNTLFYAFIFFIFTSTKRAYRHARRLRKGKCPICAYDLQYDNTLGCPECGWRKA
jgi:hypothetical protein